MDSKIGRWILLFSGTLLFWIPVWTQDAELPAELDSLTPNREIMDFLNNASINIGQADIPAFVEEVSELRAVYREGGGGRTPSDPANRFCVNLNSMWYATDSLTTGMPWINAVQVTGEFSFQGLPFQASGGVLGNGAKPMPGSSWFNIRFDHQKYLKQLEAKYFPNPATFEEMIHSPDFSHFTLEEREAIQKEGLFRFYAAVVNHPSFYAAKAGLQASIDSLSEELVKRDTIKDSLKNDKVELGHRARAHQDSVSLLLERGENRLRTIQRIENAYRHLVEWKKGFDHSLMQSVEEKAVEEARKAREQQGTDGIRDKLSAEKSLTFGEKLLLLSKGLELGTINPVGTPYTLRFIPLNGARYHFQSNRFFGEVAYGREMLQASFFQSFGLPFLGEDKGREIFHLRAGVGQEEVDFLQFSLVNGIDYGGKDTSLFIPRRSFVYSISGKTPLSEQVSLVAEVAFADNSYLNSGLENGASSFSAPGEKRLAFSSGIELTNSRKTLTVSTGTFYVGPLFASLGNPFVLTNRKGVSLSLEGQMIDRKLAISIEGKYGLPVDEQFSHSSFFDWQLVGNIQYVVNPELSVQASYMPNLFRQREVNSDEVNYSVTNSLATVQLVSQSNTASGFLTHVLSVSNYRFQFDQLDTSSQAERNIYLAYNGTLDFTGGSAITINSFSGFDAGKDNLSVSTWSHQGRYSFPIGQQQGALGAEYLQDRLVATSQIGLLFGFRLTLLKTCQWSGNFSLRHELQKKLGFHQFFITGNTTLSSCF